MQVSQLKDSEIRKIKASIEVLDSTLLVILRHLEGGKSTESTLPQYLSLRDKFFDELSIIVERTKIKPSDKRLFLMLMGLRYYPELKNDVHGHFPDNPLFKAIA
jgi:hypothetical protein